MRLAILALVLLTGCVRTQQPYTMVDCEGQHERYNHATKRCEHSK
jgi:hypothetical protein